MELRKFWVELSETKEIEKFLGSGRYKLLENLNFLSLI